METVMFVLENKNLLLKLLGFSYGRIYFDGYHTLNVCTINAADNILKEAVELGHIDDEGVAKIKQQMVEANVAPDIDKIYTAISEYTADEDFVSSYKFMGHEGCPHPLPHGVVVCKDGKCLSNPIRNLETGLSVVLEMADSDKHDVLDCIDIFKQMLAFGLPADEAAMRQQLKEEMLKENVGTIFAPHLDTMVDMLSAVLGLSVTIVEIKLPLRADKPNTDTPDQPEASPKA